MATLYRVRTAITGFTGGAMLNTTFWDGSTGTESQAASAMAQFWFDVRNYISNSFTMTVEPFVYHIDSISGLATGVAATSTTAVTGNDSADEVPGLIQGLVSIHTGVFVAGREQIGKIFIPGPTEASNTVGKPNSTYYNALDTAAFTLWSTTTPKPVVYSRTHHAYTSLGGATCSRSWAMLRSRRS